VQLPPEIDQSQTLLVSDVHAAVTIMTTARWDRLKEVPARGRTSTTLVSYVINDGPRPVAEAIRTPGRGPDRRTRVQAQRAHAGPADPTHQHHRPARPDLSKPLFTELAGTIDDAAVAAGHRLVLGATRFDAAREAEQPQALVDARVDALVMAPTSPALPDTGFGGPPGRFPVGSSSCRIRHCWSVRSIRAPIDTLSNERVDDPLRR
jgi:hypothetical protein